MGFILPSAPIFGSSHFLGLLQAPSLQILHELLIAHHRLMVGLRLVGFACSGFAPVSAIQTPFSLSKVYPGAFSKDSFVVFITKYGHCPSP